TLHRIVSALPVKGIALWSPHHEVVAYHDGHRVNTEAITWGEQLLRYTEHWAQLHAHQGLGRPIALHITTADGSVGGLHSFTDRADTPWRLMLWLAEGTPYPSTHIDSWLGQLRWELSRAYAQRRPASTHQHQEGAAL
ncbi:MAG: hypothetical protein AAFS10_14150, partial [Myxococcota bacterium]